MYEVEGALPRATQEEIEGMVTMLQKILSKMENLDARLEVIEKRSHIQREKVPSDTSGCYSRLRAQLLQISRGTRDESLYDEFGNCTGSKVELDQESDGEEEDEETPDRISPKPGESDGEHANGASIEGITASNDLDMDNQIVLVEDKKYYSIAERVYGEDVEALVMDEDEPPFEVWVKNFSNYVSTQFLIGLMSNPSLVQTVALVGHLHHGKSIFLDMLVEPIHHISTFDPGKEKHMRYTYTRIDEHERKISIKAIPMSLVLEDSNSKFYLCNIMDTLGHVNFSDEMSVVLRLADGAMLMVDAAKRVMVNTERATRHAIQEQLPIVVVINKIDRLIMELKLPPNNSYHKLRHTIEIINDYISVASSVAGSVQVIGPAVGWFFTLQSFAKLYLKLHGMPFDANELASRLWGNFQYHSDTRNFKKKNPVSGGKRSFAQFALEPLYKIYSRAIGDHKKSVGTTLAELGITLSNAAYKLNVRPLLRFACSSVFGSASGMTDMLVQHIPSAKVAASKKLEHIYTEPSDFMIYKSMELCDPFQPLMVNVTKLYPGLDCSAFNAFGRVYDGEIQTGQTLRVLGKGYSPSEKEDMVVKEVTKLWIYQARYKISTTKAYPCTWVLIEGVDVSIMKTVTLCNVDYDEDVYKFWPLQFITLPAVKTATEPLNPRELPKMVEGLRKIMKGYPLAITKVEESGDADENMQEAKGTIDAGVDTSNVENGVPDSRDKTVQMVTEIKVQVSKRKVKEMILHVTELIYGGLSKGDLQAAVEMELEMAFQDRKMEETKDKNNDAEAYVYEMRNKLKKSLNTGQVAPIQWLNIRGMKKSGNVTKYWFTGRGMMTITWELLFDLHAKYLYDTLEDKGVIKGGVLMRVNTNIGKRNIMSRSGYKRVTGELRGGCYNRQRKVNIGR